MRGTAKELQPLLFGGPSKRKPRTNWKRELKMERTRTLDEAINALKAKVRNPSTPKDWHKAYWSAISTLEIMKPAH